MIGFGSFGNFAYPTRRPFGDPQSGQVQSDQEFGNSWQSKLDSVPKTLTGMNTTQLIMGNEGYDAAKAAKYVNPIMDQNKSMFTQQAQAAGWDAGKIGTEWQSATNMGYTPTIGADGAIQLSINPYGTNPGAIGRANADAMGYAGGQTVGEEYTYTNPEWTRLNDAWQQATKERGENQIRQQQAYDTYLAGDGNIGGVIRGQYANPTAGMITGQEPGSSMSGLPGFGGINTGLTGVDDTSQSGAYSGGSGRYNPSPYSPDAFTNRNPWAFR
jgi:hypothetical protein